MGTKWNVAQTFSTQCGTLALRLYAIAYQALAHWNVSAWEAANLTITPVKFFNRTHLVHYVYRNHSLPRLDVVVIEIWRKRVSNWCRIMVSWSQLGLCRLRQIIPTLSLTSHNRISRRTQFRDTHNMSDREPQERQSNGNTKRKVRERSWKVFQFFAPYLKTLRGYRFVALPGVWCRVIPCADLPQLAKWTPGFMVWIELYAN